MAQSVPGDSFCDQHGVWGPRKLMDHEYEGVLRTTFLIDRNGNIARVFENVKPAAHSAEVLAATKSL
jgi:peroxiredoxin Q/BCP